MSDSFDVHDVPEAVAQWIEDIGLEREIVLSKSGTPLARLIPIVKFPNHKRFGALAGLIPEISDEEWKESDRAVRDLFKL